MHGRPWDIFIRPFRTELIFSISESVGCDVLWKRAYFSRYGVKVKRNPIFGGVGKAYELSTGYGANRGFLIDTAR